MFSEGIYIGSVNAAQAAPPVGGGRPGVEDQRALPITHCGGIHLLSPTPVAAGAEWSPILQMREWRLPMSGIV